MSESVLDFSVKASLFRGVVHVLKQDAKLSVIEAALSRATATLVRELPPATAWVDGKAMTELEQSMLAVLGERAVHDIAKRSIAAEIGPITRSITDGIVRLFGASPATMFPRIAMFEALSTKGVKTSWESTGLRSGELHTRYPTSRGLPDAGAIFSAGMLESVFDICRVSGTVRFTAWTSEARNDAKYDVRW